MNTAPDLTRIDFNKLDHEATHLRLVTTNFDEKVREGKAAVSSLDDNLKEIFRDLDDIQRIVDDQLTTLNELPEMEFSADNWGTAPPREEASRTVALLLSLGGHRLLELSKRFNIVEMTSPTMRVLDEHRPQASKRLVDALARLRESCDELAAWGQDMIDNARIVETHGEALRSGWVSHVDAQKAAGLK